MVSFSSVIYRFKTTLTACVIALHFLPFSVYIVNKLLLLQSVDIIYFCMAFCVLWTQVSPYLVDFTNYMN